MPISPLVKLVEIVLELRSFLQGLTPDSQRIVILGDDGFGELREAEFLVVLGDDTCGQVGHLSNLVVKGEERQSSLRLILVAVAC